MRRRARADFIWWACGIAVRFPQRVVAETFAPNVEVEVVMASSLLQCAFCTDLSIFELARLPCYLQQFYVVSVRLRLLSLGPVFVQMPVQGRRNQFGVFSTAFSVTGRRRLQPAKTSGRSCQNPSELRDACANMKLLTRNPSRWLHPLMAWAGLRLADAQRTCLSS